MIHKLNAFRFWVKMWCPTTCVVVLSCHNMDDLVIPSDLKMVSK